MGDAYFGAPEPNMYVRGTTKAKVAIATDEEGNPQYANTNTRLVDTKRR